MTTTPPNWYPDPHNAAFVRWWDGQRWTEHVQPAAAPGAPPTPAQPPARADTPIGAEGAQADSARRKVWLFGARAAARDLAEENDQLRASLERAGALGLAEIELRTADAHRELADLQVQVHAASRELESLRSQMLDVRHAIDVSEFGLYDFEHPPLPHVKMPA